MEVSLTEENYIKAIWTISRQNEGQGASTNELSAQLSNKAASVTDMLKRLAEKKLVHYEKYRSAHLTEVGERLAIGIVRKHRLWEVFLMEKLRFKWDEVHDIAEQLEHIRSEELVDRLDKFLGHPRFDPHGDPIPDAKGKFKHNSAVPLSDCDKKGGYIFMGVTEHSRAFLQHLTSIGLKIGDEIRVQEVNTFDHSFRIRINEEKSQYISDKVSAHLLVEPKK